MTRNVPLIQSDLKERKQHLRLLRVVVYHEKGHLKREAAGFGSSTNVENKRESA